MSMILTLSVNTLPYNTPQMYYLLEITHIILCLYPGKILLVLASHYLIKLF